MMAWTFDAAYHPRTHPHFYYGHPCRCPWGHDEGGEHLGSAKTSAKIDWLKERPDMQDAAGQRFLSFLEDNQYVTPGTDKLLPWIVREWRKGHLALPEGHENMLKRGRSSYFGPTHAEDILNTMRDLKKYKLPTFDPMQHSVDEVFFKAKQGRDKLDERDKPNRGEVVHRYDDNWTVRKLRNAREARIEGKEMNHCVGGFDYPQGIDDKKYHIYSLRDPNNNPYVTIQLNRNHDGHEQCWRCEGEGHHPQPHPNEEESQSCDNCDGSGEVNSGYSPVVDQFYGHDDNPPEPEHTERANEWLQHIGSDPQAGIDKWWNDSYLVPGADDVREYLGMHNGTGEGPEPDDDYYRACHDAEAHDMQEPDLEYDEHNFGDIWNSHTTPQETRWYNRHPTYSGPHGFDPEEAESLHEAAGSAQELDKFHDAWKDWRGEDQGEGFWDPHDKQVDDWWKQRFAQHVNPDTGEFEHPKWVGSSAGTPVWETAMDRWWQQNQQNYPQIPGVEWQQPGQNPPLPDYMRKNIISRIASEAGPLYYRWVLDPTTADVELSANTDDHPALVPGHEQMAGKLNRPNLSHGYAYRIHGGWRLTDWEHRPVEDRFVTSTVMRALAGKDPIRETQDEPSWEPAHYDFDKTHHGLPQPVEDWT